MAASLIAETSSGERSVGVFAGSSSAAQSDLERAITNRPHSASALLFSGQYNLEKWLAACAFSSPRRSAENRRFKQNTQRSEATTAFSTLKMEIYPRPLYLLLGAPIGNTGQPGSYTFWCMTPLQDHLLLGGGRQEKTGGGAGHYLPLPFLRPPPLPPPFPFPFPLPFPAPEPPFLRPFSCQAPSLFLFLFLSALFLSAFVISS